MLEKILIPCSKQVWVFLIILGGLQSFLPQNERRLQQVFSRVSLRLGVSWSSGEGPFFL